MTGQILGTRGGVTGTAVVLGDVDRLADVLRACAGALAAEAARCEALAADPDLLASAPRSPVTAARAVAGILAVALGPHGAVRCAIRLTVLGVRLELAAAAYRQVEEAQAVIWRELDHSAGMLLGLALPVIPVSLTIGAVVAVADATGHGAELARATESLLATPALRSEVEQLLTQHPELVRHAADGLGGLLSGVAVGTAARSGGLLVPGMPPLAALAATLPQSREQIATMVDGMFTPGAYRVEQAPRQPQPPASPQHLEDLARLLLPVGEPAPGWVDLHEVTTTHSDGTTGTAYLLVLPGTDDWSLPTGQRDTSFSRDLGANVQLMAGRQTELTRSLPALLDMAGVPEGAALGIVGHSQGGLVAMQAAADVDLRSRVHITDVITFGAPVAAMPHPEEVHVLSLENRGDIVVQPDGGDNPDRADHLTVQFDDGQRPKVGGDLIGSRHEMAAYARGAALVDAAVMGGGVATVATVAGAEALAGLRHRGLLTDGRSVVRSTRWQVSVDRRVRRESRAQAGS